MCVWNKVSKNKAILKIFRFWWLCKLRATEKNIWKSKCDKNVKKYPIHMIQSAFESLSDGLSNALWIMMIGQKEKILDDFFKTIDLNFSLAWYRILYPKHLKVSYIDLKYLELSWSRLQEVWGIVQCFDPNCFKQISYGRMF